VIAGPGDERAAGKGRGRGELRASHADREQAIEVLKDAFAQGRLTRDELDSRVGQAFASRTYAELAAVTADIPAWTAIAPPREPARARNRAPGTHSVRNGAIVSGVGLIIAAAAALGGPVYNDGSPLAVPLLILAAFIVIVVVPLVMLTAVTIAWEQRRSSRQLPPRPGQGDQAPEGRRDAAIGHDPAHPDADPDQNRADLRTHSPRPGRQRSSGPGARAPRGLWPAPGAV